jgi:hypothetical protein
MELSFYLVICNAVNSGESLKTFRKRISSPYSWSQSKAKESIGACFMLAPCLAYSSTSNKEVICSSKI